tara:strand:+ start:275 stop:409 length:135 start_codon:yes stop_codon:yes gene_type:complete
MKLLISPSELTKIVNRPTLKKLRNEPGDKFITDFKNKIKIIYGS